MKINSDHLRMNFARDISGTVDVSGKRPGSRVAGNHEISAKPTEW